MFRDAINNFIKRMIQIYDEKLQALLDTFPHLIDPRRWLLLERFERWIEFDEISDAQFTFIKAHFRI